jgi:hypothetical protein
VDSLRKEKGDREVKLEETKAALRKVDPWAPRLTCSTKSSFVIPSNIYSVLDMVIDYSSL